MRQLTPGVLFIVVFTTACAAAVPTPTPRVTATVSAAETDPAGFGGATCAEIAAEFAGELVARLETLVTTAAGDALRTRVEGATHSLAAGLLDHLFDEGLGGQCRLNDFTGEIDAVLPASVYTTLEAAGYSLYDRLAIPLSAMELDERVQRMPPVPIRPAPEFGSGPWGPLAVLQGGGEDGDLAAAGGALLIADSCVTVGDSTVVFRSAQVRWNADRETITFWDPLGDVAVEIRHGDHVRFGGGALAPGGDFDWASEPDPACSMEGAFAVSSVGEVNGVRIRDFGPGGG